MSDELAKEMRAAVTDEEKQRAWDRLHTWEQGEYLSMARAAREYYSIPKGAEKGAVGVLVDALDRAIGICQGGFNICEECPVKKPGGCMYLDAKRALGEMEVT